MDSTRVHRTEATDHDETVEAHHSGLERLDRPHGCMDGLVFIGHLVEDSEAGEEVEVFEAVPCQRCAKS